jgi:hypothetical protein
MNLQNQINNFIKIDTMWQPKGIQDNGEPIPKYHQKPGKTVTPRLACEIPNRVVLLVHYGSIFYSSPIESWLKYQKTEVQD